MIQFVKMGALIPVDIINNRNHTDICLIHSGEDQHLFTPHFNEIYNNRFDTKNQGYKISSSSLGWSCLGEFTRLET